MERYEPTSRTAVKRLPKRAAYDRETVYAILDEALVCHVGFSVEGQPFVIPTGYGRSGDRLYIHGSAASRMLKTIGAGIPVCVTVTLIDGLVLARSAFHHSVNYRSVVILGTARPVEDPVEKMEALRIFTEHMIPGRWAEVREPNGQELKATDVLSIDLTEVSAKIRTGPPLDDEEDMEIQAWAGVLPLELAPGSPIDDPLLKPGIDRPDYVLSYSRRKGR